MPSRCCVPGCGTYAKYSNKGSGVSFFRFPKDPSFRAKWVDLCEVKGLPDFSKVAVCSKHFDKSDMDVSYLVKQSLLSRKVRPSLKADALPSKRIPSRPTNKPDKFGRGERSKKREDKEMIKKLLESHSEETCTVEPDVSMIMQHSYRAGGSVIDRRVSAQTGTPLDRGQAVDAADTRFVARAKELLQKKARLRRLEEKYKRLLTASPAGAAAAAAGPTPETMMEVSDVWEPADADDAAAGGEPGAVREEGPAAAAAAGSDGPEPAYTDAASPGEQGAAAAGVAAGRGRRDSPLMVLREAAPSLPGVIGKLREHQLSVQMEMLVPSDLQEALDVNHRLKVQNLSMQIGFVKWAIKNKRMADFKMKLLQKRFSKTCERVVKRKRLRELENLESAVKQIFTDSQIRAMTREYATNCQEWKKTVQWREEDLRRALELRAISSDAVLNHVRLKMQIPLPSMMTLKTRCKKFPLLDDMYTEMLLKSRAGPHCGMCRRLLRTIDEVADPAAGGASLLSPPAGPALHGRSAAPERGAAAAAASRQTRHRELSPDPLEMSGEESGRDDEPYVEEALQDFVGHPATKNWAAVRAAAPPLVYTPALKRSWR